MVRLNNKYISATTVSITVILLGFGSIIGLFLYFDQQNEKLLGKKSEALSMVESWNTLQNTTKDLLIADDLQDALRRWEVAINKFDIGLNSFIQSNIIQDLTKDDIQFANKIKETENLWRVIKPRIKYAQPRLAEHLAQKDPQNLTYKRSLLHELLYQMSQPEHKSDYMILFDLTYDIEYMVSSLNNYFVAVLTDMVDRISYIIDGKTQRIWNIAFLSVLLIVSATFIFIFLSQKALRDSEERFRHIVELSPLPIAIIDTAERIEYINSKFTEVFGYGLDDITNMEEWYRKAYPDSEYRQKVILYRESVLSNTDNKDIEPRSSKVTCKDGTIRNVISRVVIMSNDKKFVIAEDITDRKRAEEALRESEKQLRFLSAQLILAEEKERKRIAYELHDEVGQALTAIKFGIENILNLIEKKRILESIESLEGLIALIQNAVVETRRISVSLRPAIIDQLGIIATITWYCREYTKIYSEVDIDQRIDVQERLVPDALKIVIYRILQESLTNIAKHSNAEFVQVSLTKRNSRLQMAVKDSGPGFDLAEALSRTSVTGGFGLVSMRERVELSGGILRIDTAKGQGTEIQASWPV